MKKAQIVITAKTAVIDRYLASVSSSPICERNVLIRLFIYRVQLTLLLKDFERVSSTFNKVKYQES